MKFRQSQGWRGVQPTNVRSSPTTPTVTIWSTFGFSRLVGITFSLKALFVTRTLFIPTTLIRNAYQNKFVLLNVITLNKSKILYYIIFKISESQIGYIFFIKLPNQKVPWECSIVLADLAANLQALSKLWSVTLLSSTSQVRLGILYLRTHVAWLLLCGSGLLKWKAYFKVQ